MEIIGMKEYRRQLAELTAQTGADEEALSAAYKAAAIQACLLMARHYGEALERVKLWDRIASGLSVATGKAGCDMERWIAELSAWVQADVARFASDNGAVALIDLLSGWDEATRQGFIRYVAQRLPVIIVLARKTWKEGLNHA